jgi:hypothetical protein
MRCLGPVICDGDDGSVDVFFDTFKQGFTDESRTAKNGIDVHKKPYLGIVLEQVKDLEDVFGRFSTVLRGQVITRKQVLEVVPETG